MDEADIYGATDATSRVGKSFRTRLPETFYEDFASILEACEIEDEETSGNATSLHAPILEAPETGQSTRVRPRVTNGGGGKAGNRDKDDATSGGATTFHTQVQETLTAGPSTRVRPRLTNGGGGKAGNQSNDEDTKPGMGICKRTDGKGWE